jgi:thioredoxin reductase (NADPH)
MLKNNYAIKTDIAIIGAGPAGLAAGIYGAQDRDDFLLLDNKEPCWFFKESVNSHYYVDGYTGIDEKMTGSELQNKFLKHYKRLGGKFFKEKVINIKKNKNEFIVKTEISKIVARSIILATGTTPIPLIINGTNKFSKNIHYYCTLDGKKYIGKNVFVVGGRNSGAVTAIYLHDIGCKVTLIEVKDNLQSKNKYTKKIKERDIKVIINAKLKALKGNKSLSSVILEIMNTGELEELPAKAIFVCVGRLPNLNFLDLKLKTDENGYIIVDCFNETSSSGVFAAGDLTCKLKQIISACGDGANAYYFAKKFLKNKKINIT